MLPRLLAHALVADADVILWRLNPVQPVQLKEISRATPYSSAASNVEAKRPLVHEMTLQPC